MTKPLVAYLQDVINAIAKIEMYTQQVASLKDFENNAMVQDAVNYQLAIIGEALNKALKQDSSLKVSDARRVVDFRNFLIHSYDTVVAARVWDTLQYHLPILKAEVQALLPPDATLL